MHPATQHDLGKLILRVALGVLVLLHGIAKLTGGLSHITGMVEKAGLPGPLAYGVLVGEVVGPLLVILGFHARIGAALIAVNMLFAIGLAHMGELATLTATGGWALELQGMFLAAALALACFGPGRWSVNQR